MESDNNRSWSWSQVYVCFIDHTDTFINHIYRNFFGREFHKGIRQCFYRPVHISFNDQRQFPGSSIPYLTADFIQSLKRIGPKFLFAVYTLTLSSDPFNLPFIIHTDKMVSGLGNIVKSLNLNRISRVSFFNTDTLVINHSPDTSCKTSADKRITNMKRAPLNKHRSDGSQSFIQTGFNDSTPRHTFKGWLQFQYFRFQ